jgi:hypothetical protein
LRNAVHKATRLGYFASKRPSFEGSFSTTVGLKRTVELIEEALAAGEIAGFGVEGLGAERVGLIEGVSVGGDFGVAHAIEQARTARTDRGVVRQKTARDLFEPSSNTLAPERHTPYFIPSSV